MMSKNVFKSVFTLLMGLMLIVAFAVSAQAQLAKRGTYSGLFGWNNMGETTELGDGNNYWVGQFRGTFFNDADSGFLHESSVICPASGTVVGGQNFYRGSCILTDKDGDKAVLLWEGQFNAQGRLDGPFQWVVGTGKYKGITGNSTFYASFDSEGLTQGYNVWNGEWRLP